MAKRDGLLFVVLSLQDDINGAQYGFCFSYDLILFNRYVFVIDTITKEDRLAILLVQ
jgi:hypothetical protein